MTQDYTLPGLGWSAHFMQQLDIDEIGVLLPARVAAVHRDRIDSFTEAGATSLIFPPDLGAGEVAVGDFVLFRPDTARVERVLDRKTVLHRRAAGTDARDQLIAANLDTLFITTSMNADFNSARLERYLALAHSADVQPVIILTKADLCSDPAPYEDALRQIAPDVPALMLDARLPNVSTRLADWCGPGQTIAFLGSSGVGKSTLTASLTGETPETQDIREDDAKGRHTTTARHLYPIPDGGWLIDTPGMRALRLTGAEAGIDAVFADVADLATQCRFSDCAHDTEPGCAVQAAIADGTLDPARLLRWQKLLREDRRNSETIAQAHARNKSFGKMVKGIMRERQKYRD